MYTYKKESKTYMLAFDIDFYFLLILAEQGIMNFWSVFQPNFMTCLSWPLWLRLVIEIYYSARMMGSR